MSKVQRSEQDRREQLFLVRIWWEPSAATSTGAWRGRVEDVNNGERSYFVAMPDLVAFIDERLVADSDATQSDSTQRSQK